MEHSGKVDLLEVVGDMSVSEKFVFFLMKSKIVYDPHTNSLDHIVKVKPSQELGKNDQNRFSSGLKKLVANGIVKKVKPFHYLINPDLLIPAKHSYYKRIWEESNRK